MIKNPGLEREEVLEELEAAVAKIERSMDPRLVPDDGARFGYAIAGARDRNGIAAVPGGIVREGTGVKAAGPCGFGTDEAISQVILTAMKFDPTMRSAMVIRYSPAIAKVLDEMFLVTKSFDRCNAPPGISTMDWGIALCCADGVPDAIFDTGGRESESRIRLFGESLADISNNIIMLSNRTIRIEF